MIDDRLHLILIVLGKDIFIHWRYLLLIKYLEAVSRQGASRSTLARWVSQIIASVGVSGAPGARPSGRRSILEVRAHATKVKLLLEGKILVCMLEASHGHLRFGNLNVSLGANLLALLS